MESKLIDSYWIVCCIARCLLTIQEDSTINKARDNLEPPVKPEEKNQESKLHANHPDERLREFLRVRFPGGLPPSRRPKEDNPYDLKNRMSRKRGKMKAPVSRQLPKPKEK